MLVLAWFLVAEKFGERKARVGTMADLLLFPSFSAFIFSFSYFFPLPRSPPNATDEQPRQFFFL